MKYLHTMVRARDLDETLDFYCNKLGLVQVDRHDSEAGRFSLVFLAAPGDAERAREGSSPLLEITWNWDPEDYTGGRNFGHLAYRVDDIYALCQQLRERGVTINRPPRDGRIPPGGPSRPGLHPCGAAHPRSPGPSRRRRACP